MRQPVDVYLLKENMAEKIGVCKTRLRSCMPQSL